jgi:hypothetical protein
VEVAEVFPKKIPAAFRPRGKLSRAHEVARHSESANSWKGLISISLGPIIGLGQRLTQATASSMSLTSHIQKPATKSRGLLKGPSITVLEEPLKATRLPSHEGVRPSPVCIMPAYMATKQKPSLAYDASLRNH